MFRSIHRDYWRYIAICRPLEARRDAAGPRNTRLAAAGALSRAAGAFFGSALIELPVAWTYSITRFDCRHTYYLLDHPPRLRVDHATNKRA